MIQGCREGALSKQEAQGQLGQASSRELWSSALKNPRIVRVSRAFGGKDRHSKVRTVRGLRDRRIRLSVATALQLYDLQDKLGLSQPSKVVDWLISAAQHEIDKLPPLEAVVMAAMTQANLVRSNPRAVMNYSPPPPAATEFQSDVGIFGGSNVLGDMAALAKMSREKEDMAAAICHAGSGVLHCYHAAPQDHIDHCDQPVHSGTQNLMVLQLNSLIKSQHSQDHYETYMPPDGH